MPPARAAKRRGRPCNWAHMSATPPISNQTVLFFTGRVDAPGDITTFDAWTDRSLLDSMEGGGINWPSSCRNGTCRTCFAQVLSGQVQHMVEWPGLSSDEMADGFALPCVAHPLGDVCLRRPD
jgi:ferredoxin